MPTKLKLLPTLATFKRLSFVRKARVFRDWAATMKGEFNPMSTGDCALCQFGRALRVDVFNAGCYSFSLNQTGYPDVEVLDNKLTTSSPIWGKSTFAALTRRLDTYITKHYPKSR